jgi:drug/metabolite transporter (DMT)-like permease
MQTKTPDRLTLIAFVLTILFAGNNAIAVKFTYAELPPFSNAALRFAVSALILFIVMAVMRIPFPRGKSLWGAVIFGILSTGVNYALMYWALQYIQAGLSMTILALVPLLTFLAALAHRQEAFRWSALAGALLAVVGIGIISWDQVSVGAPLLPILAVVAAAICFAESSVLIKGFPRTHPITTNAIALLTGSIFLWVFSLLWRETFRLPTLPQTWIALVYLVIFGTVATFVLSLFVLKRWTASASSYLFVLMPIVTISVGALVANESVTVPFLVGGAFVLAGAYVGGIANTEQWRCAFLGFLRSFRTSVPGCKEVVS